jgi:ParB-like chromosome segregation protein Spo0J
MIARHKIDTLPLGRLTAAEYNPRQISAAERASLRESLRLFGLVQPFVVRAEDCLLVGGHQRADALRAVLAEDGLPPAQVAEYPVPAVLVSGLTEAQTKGLNLALNKIGGDWDFEKLSAVLSDISASTDAVVTGFSDAEIADILALIPTEDVLVDSGVDPETPNAGVSAEADAHISDLLARDARKFRVEVATQADAETCVAALRAHGYTTPRTLPAAFVAVCRAALEAK